MPHPVGTTRGQVPTWITGVLNGIGAPVNSVNVKALRMWAASEGMPTNYNNWLATSTQGNGWINTGNSAGVGAFQTESEGVQATVTTLNNSYPGVVSAFRNSGSSKNPLYSIWKSINQSPWCAGCEGGNYPSGFNIGTNKSGIGVTPIVPEPGLPTSTKSGQGCSSKPPLLSQDIKVTTITITACEGKAMLGLGFSLLGVLLFILGISFLGISFKTSEIKSLVPAHPAATKEEEGEANE